MNNPSVLITGASRGLGEVLVRRFWSEGYNLHLVARDIYALQILKQSLPVAQQSCTLHICDLSDTQAVESLCHQVVFESWPVDVLINNAAIHGPIGPLTDNDFSLWTQTIAVNLLAPVALCQAVVKLMLQRGSGSIINLSGGGATGPRPNFTAYASAKAALVRFTESLALELKDSSTTIRVNCIAPGAMKTALLKEVLEQGKEVSGLREFTAAQKIFSGDDSTMSRVADLAVFLASVQSALISGKLISAQWDRWDQWSAHADVLESSDVYTLRRITGRDRGYTWGDL